jgi:hypothetical protein
MPSPACPENVDLTNAMIVTDIADLRNLVSKEG